VDEYFVDQTLLARISSILSAEENDEIVVSAGIEISTGSAVPEGYDKESLRKVDEAYQILNMTPDITDDEIRTYDAYRALREVKTYRERLFQTEIEDVSLSRRLERLKVEISKILQRKVVGRDYAYLIFTPYHRNLVCLVFAGNDNGIFEKKKQEIQKVVEQVNFIFFDEIQYARYEVIEVRNKKVEEKVRRFYSSISDYIVVKVLDEVFGTVVRIYAAPQVMGRIIGKKGANINKLREMLREDGISDVFAHEDRELEEKYRKEKGLPLHAIYDPETFQLLVQAMDIVKKLEKKGLSLDDLKQFMERYKKQEEYEITEEDDQHYTGVI